MPQPYLWLRQILAQLLPELEHLPVGPEQEICARAWFERLIARFTERGLVTPAQQKNRVVDARNAIRARFGDDHPALAYVGFDEQTWQAINLPTHDRTEARNENQRLLRHPEKIVARAAKLLASPRFEDLAVGLGVTVGRRISELLDGHARLEPATAWSVCFTGQRKHRGDREDFSFEVPTLAPAVDVLAAWQRLLVMLGDQVLDPQTINHRYGHAVNAAADRHFRGLVPPRLPPAPKPGTESLADDPHGRERRGDALYLHLFRAVYATIAVHWFCPPKVNRLVFKAEIQGHRQILDAPTPVMRRSYAASRHYDDYQIADASGKNIDGRQGVKLGELPGVEVLRVFQASRPKPTPATAPIEPIRPPTTMDPSTPDTTLVSPTASESPAAPPVNPPSATDADGEASPVRPAKKPRPVTYRIYPADRPRLDAFRIDPKQSQADNLHQVVDLLENASAAIRAQDQMQAQLQAAQAHATQAAAQAEQAAAERDQARQEAQDAASRLTAQATELERLQQAMGQAQAQATAAQAAGGGSTVALAVVARELLALATEAACPAGLQGRLISLATQTLGGGNPAGSGARLAAPTSPSRKIAKAPADPARFGPLFAGGAASPAATTGITDAPRGRESEKPGLDPSGTTDAQAPAPATPTTPPNRPSHDAQEPPGASEPSLAPSTALRSISRRSGAADKLAKALQAVLTHNQAQTAREKKWTVTESALARLTGCFRPAVRAFFAVHAEEIEAHNLQHHLLPGLNAVRGKRGDAIETEIAWRERETENPPAPSENGEDRGKMASSATKG